MKKALSFAVGLAAFTYYFVSKENKKNKKEVKKLDLELEENKNIDSDSENSSYQEKIDTPVENTIEEAEEDVVKKAEELASMNNKRRLIDLNIDLQLADFEEGSFRVIQKISCDNKEILNCLINDLFTDGYKIEKLSDDCIMTEIVIEDKDSVKPVMMELLERCLENKINYEGFKIRMV